MIETPLYGKFIGENKRLVFIAPPPYQVLVKGCVGGGALMALYGFYCSVTGTEPIQLYPAWWFYIGGMVAVAGFLAALSLQSMSFDLREKHYKRRQGPGVFPVTTHGSVSELDALVLIAEPNPLMVANGVTYHLVLHWKGQRQPPMVVQQDTRQVRPGDPLNAAAVQLLQRGMSYASAIGIPFYDNSHFPSTNPSSIFRRY